MEYGKGNKKDREEIVYFINEVFQEDFHTIMPKVYHENIDYEYCHHLIKENGKIVAVVGVYKQDFYIKENKLKIGFVGSVSVDKTQRGKGYMKLLMKKAQEGMLHHNIDIAMLGGLRNRYGFFGYEIGGQLYEFQFIEENIRHTVGWQEGKKVEFIPVEKEADILDDIYYLYQKNVVSCRTREDFYNKSRTWNNELYQIKIEEKFAGYFIINSSFHYILEIELIDWKQLLWIVKECMVRNKDKSLQIQAHTWELEKLSALQEVCESYQLKTDCCYKILNYERTIKSLLELKQSYTKLEESEFVLEVEDHGIFEIRIENGTIRIQQGKKEKVDMKLKEREVISALLSPIGKIYERKAKKAYPANWFPLEFSICNADKF